MAEPESAPAELLCSAGLTSAAVLLLLAPLVLMPLVFMDRLRRLRGRLLFPISGDSKPGVGKGPSAGEDGSFTSLVLLLL